MTTLYKINKTATRVWSCIVNDDTLVITHGLLNGNHQTDVIVRPNTASAKLEAQSRIAHKVSREGYSLTPEGDAPGQPMLLQKYRDFHHKLPTVVYYQPKLNGYRCIGSASTMMSRKNTGIFSLPHIQYELNSLPPDVFLDGELYHHGMSLQQIGSFVRSDDPKPGCDEIEYHIFDVQMDKPYALRLQYLQSLPSFNFIKIIPTTRSSKDLSDYMLQTYLSQGYEGVVIKDPNGMYEKDTRSYSVQKLKPEFTEYFVIKSITAAKKGREKGAAIVECINDAGKSFRARMTGDIGHRQTIYKMRDQLLPAKAEICFEDYTDDGIPQHPRCTEILKGM